MDQRHRIHEQRLRRTYNACLGIAVTLMCRGLSRCSPAPSLLVSGHPKIIVVLVDDSGWMDFGRYGNHFIESRQADRLREKEWALRPPMPPRWNGRPRARRFSRASMARLEINQVGQHLVSHGASQAIVNPQSKMYEDWLVVAIRISCSTHF